ncbi:hypothetical protein [Pendulispora rubella]|uniref:hypothetical protein n=1 Tax=Pendulispora rubella TaxID=2741070 RepID=UPI0030E23F7F
MADEDPKKRGSSAPPSSRPSRPSEVPPSSRTGAPARSTRPPQLSTAFRLSGIDFDLMGAARRILEGALGVVPGERVVVLVDRARRDIGLSLADAARNIGARAAIFSLEEYGDRPMRHIPSSLQEALTDAQASVFLAGFDDGEMALRYELLARVRHLNLRHAHMVGISRKSMIGGFSVDPSRILDATRAVRMRLRPESVLRVRSVAGSDLEVRCAPSLRWAEFVGVLRPGRWEHLPSGSLVTSPSSVSGVFVADASIGTEAGANVGLLDKAPVRFEIDQGLCRAVRCDDRSLDRHLMDFMRREASLDRVGLAILGTNIGIHAATGEVTSDQNLPGIHLGFGATYPEHTGATWSGRAQITAAASTSDVDLDGVPLVRSGRLLV